MTKRTVREDDVVLAYWEQIDCISMPYRRALGREDAHMEGLSGLLFAIRSYRENYADFQSYMKQCVIQQLDLAKKNASVEVSRGKPAVFRLQSSCQHNYI